MHSQLFGIALVYAKKKTPVALKSLLFQKGYRGHSYAKKQIHHSPKTLIMPISESQSFQASQIGPIQTKREKTCSSN